jgi:uncharacterized phage protein (TIGR01671 family)
MKREILFRGKRIDNGEWIEGDLTMESGLRRAFIIMGWDYDNNNLPGPLYIAEVIPETASQFTGLIDKNGKKIFENDVVHHGYFSEPCFVVYKEAGFWCAPASKERHVLPLEMCLSSCVVIGNVFDNPKLAAKS